MTGVPLDVVVAFLTAIVSFFTTVGALGKAGVWVFGREYTNMKDMYTERLKEKDDMIAEKDAIIANYQKTGERMTDATEVIAHHVKEIRTADRLVWEGGRNLPPQAHPGRRTSRTRQRSDE